MKTVLRHELFDSFSQLQNQFNQALEDAQKQDGRFEALRNRFRNHLTARLQQAQTQLPQNNPLVGPVQNLIQLIDATNTEWDEKIAGREKGVNFRAGFNDSLLVFVYGKVKSGKSSLGNYVAWGSTEPDAALKQQVPPHLQPKYFSHERTNADYGDAEKEAEANQEFRVNATEATSSIQGFSLPGLTWVDSPGLHSVQETNGRLAREYVEHADLILYTMRSDAPARESDLQEIAELIHKDKQTLLLITGSDDIEEEDVDELGNIKSVLVMKSEERCHQQREHTRKSLHTKLSAEQVSNIQIISFSAKYAQLHQQDAAAFNTSGMGQLFSVMQQLALADGVRMKQRVPMTNFKIFLESCIRDIKPYYDLLGKFGQSIHEIQHKVPQEIRQAVRDAEEDVRQEVNHAFAQVRGLDDAAKPQAIKQAQSHLNKKCQEITQARLTPVFEKVMHDFSQSMTHTFQNSDLVALPEFAVETSEQRVASGVRSGTRKRNSGIAALVGAGAGFLIGGPAGAAAGAALGGALGHALGDDTSVRYRTIEVTVGDNLSDIHQNATSAYTQAVRQTMEETADQMLSQLLQSAQTLVRDLEQEVKLMEQDLNQLLDETQKALV